MKGNTKRLHVVAEPIEQGGGTDLPRMVTVLTYSQCMPSSQKVPVMVCNVTNEVIKLKKGMVVAKLMPADVIPNKVAPRYLEEIKPKPNKKEKKGHERIANSKSLLMNPDK